MWNEHQSSGVIEASRNKTVVASVPAGSGGAQGTRSSAAAVVVPFAYASGPKFGAP